MKRKITDLLNRWKDSPWKKPLLIRGARQVGKTYIVEEFARENYQADRIIRINFEEQPQMQEVFAGSLDPETVLDRLSQRPEFKRVDFRQDAYHPLFLFLDEIQKCPAAITSLKFLAKANSYLHVVGSGSLLGVLLNKKDNLSYPVGYVESAELFPLDFEEFLWAIGYAEPYIENLKNLAFKENVGSLIDDSVHQELMNAFQKYMVIGGMPEVVQCYVQTKTFPRCRALQQELIRGYEIDIQKYVEGGSVQKTRVSNIFQTIPRQLREKSRKFKLSSISKNAKTREYGDPLDWLIKSGLAIKCENLKAIEEPIESLSEPNDYKLYLMDTGLLLSQLAESDTYAVLDGSQNIDVGGVYENTVATILHQYRGKGPLYYYHEGSDLEIDFVDRNRRQLLLIEAKSGNNLKAASLNKLLGSGGVQATGVKVSRKLVKEDGKEKNLPFYLFALRFTNQLYLPIED